jgi:hypothetical protein
VETFREQIHVGMTVRGMDGEPLGHVFEVGEHALALQRGAFLPREWRATFIEVDHVDDQGVWLRHGRGSLERISDAFCGPTKRYRAACEDSPIYRDTLFSPPAVAESEPEDPVPQGSPPFER